MTNARTLHTQQPSRAPQTCQKESDPCTGAAQEINAHDGHSMCCPHGGAHGGSTFKDSLNCSWSSGVCAVKTRNVRTGTSLATSRREPSKQYSVTTQHGKRDGWATGGKREGYRRGHGRSRRWRGCMRCVDGDMRWKTPCYLRVLRRSKHFLNAQDYPLSVFQHNEPTAAPTRVCS